MPSPEEYESPRETTITVLLSAVFAAAEGALTNEIVIVNAAAKAVTAFISLRFIIISPTPLPYIFRVPLR